MIRKVCFIKPFKVDNRQPGRAWLKLDCLNSSRHSLFRVVNRVLEDWQMLHLEVTVNGVPAPGPEQMYNLGIA